jgi:hypothetical protein
MDFWNDMNPTIRKAVMAAGVLLVVLLVVRYVASTPAANVTSQRGVAATGQ